MTAVAGVRLDIAGPAAAGPDVDTLLDARALAFVASLARRFARRREELLDKRGEGPAPDAEIVPGAWNAAPIPRNLRDRRVELCVPARPQPLIEALNSDAMTVIADFDDLLAPAWEDILGGHLSLRGAARRTLEHTDPEGGVHWICDDTSTLVVRPRRLDRLERHVSVDGAPVPAAFFDAALHLFHNARELLEHASGPYLLLSGVQSPDEARLWSDLFEAAEADLDLPRGAIRVTLSLDSPRAVAGVEGLLHALKRHATAVQLRPWTMLAGFARGLRERADAPLPGFGTLRETTPRFGESVRRVIEICHRHGVHALAGGGGLLLSRRTEALLELARARIRAAADRAALIGFDGLELDDPELVPDAMRVLDLRMPRPNQLHRRRFDAEPDGEALLSPAKGAPGREDVEYVIGDLLLFLETRLDGGDFAVRDMRRIDAGLAEAGRELLAHAIRSGARLMDGTELTDEFVRARIAALSSRHGGTRGPLAARLLTDALLGPTPGGRLAETEPDQVTDNESRSP